MMYTLSLLLSPYRKFDYFVGHASEFSENMGFKKVLKVLLIIFFSRYEDSRYLASLVLIILFEL